MRIGAVLVPLSTLLRPPELDAQLRTAAVDHLIAVRDVPGPLVPRRPGRRSRRRSSTGIGERRSAIRRCRRCAGSGRADELPDAPAAADALVAALEDAVRPADDLVVLFTSGSRGAPKGVIHTHGGALRATAAGLDARCVGAGERLYIPMPFFWTGGFGGGLLSVLVAGATLLTEADAGARRGRSRSSSGSG